MAVRIRMKKLGRKNRPFFRVCAMDARTPRDGRVIEELGYYDPMVKDTDARAVLKAERIDYWLSVGAQPSPKVRVLIKKYGTKGSHLAAQRAALERLQVRPQPSEPIRIAIPKPPAEVPPPAEEQTTEPENDVEEMAEIGPG